MAMKKIITVSVCGIATIAALSYLFFARQEAPVSTKPEEKAPVVKVEKPIPKVKPVVEVRKKYDLYSETPYDIPLVSILEISKLPEIVKDSVDKLLEHSQGFYLLTRGEDRVFVILQNPVNLGNVYHRHDLQFAEIAFDGKITYHTAGYIGQEGEVNNNDFEDEVWEFEQNEDLQRPLKHTVFDENNKIKFTEVWIYDDKDPVKYEMKDADNKVISILKESQDNESNLRKEHIFYDNNGNITLSLTINYDGANISRLTFFNSQDSIDSVSVIAEYTNGNKTQEKIYNENYELICTLNSEYEEDKRQSITKFDPQGSELERITDSD